MKVKDVMTSEPRTCVPETTLAEAAHLMLEADCGILPIVIDHRLAGLVTDRDMFIALATRNRLASELSVGSVTGHTVWTCEPEEDVHVALSRMKEHRVRRLPVVDGSGTLVGMISMNDILLAAGDSKDVRNDEVVGALQDISAHHQPLVRVGGA